MTDKVIKHNNSIDDSLPTPLYHQIYVMMKEKICSGEYPDGTLIPTEHELEKMFAVSRITVKRALDELAAEGFVTRQRGRGTTVTFKQHVSSSSGDMDGLLEDMMTIVMETKVSILEFDYVKSPLKVAEALKLSPSTIVQKAARVRHKENTPFSYTVTYVPEDIGRSFSYDELKNEPILALIERSGIVISRARENITATLADSTTGPALGINIGSPLLRVSRIVFDEADRPVEYITIYYRPELYQLNLNLARVSGERSNIWATQQD